MDTLAGLRPTGRKVVGPASDLVEFEADNGLHHIAIQFHPVYRSHGALACGMQVVLGFLESPMVTGLVELVATSPKDGLFLYPTGKVWTVIEVVRTYARLGKVCGLKAGLELCYLAGQILHEASVNGPPQGIYCHGALTPWRLLLKGDGQVQILGYGLPQVEVLAFLEDESLVPPADSFRYCPPERLKGADEDVTSDVFSLALIAFELIAGQPVYDGLPADIRQQAGRAEAARKLYRMRELLPDPVREVFARALKYDLDTRFPDANAFVWAVKDLLGAPDVDGPSLHQIMKTIKGLPTGRAPLVGGMTGAIPKEDLEGYADDAEDERPLPDPRAGPPGSAVEVPGEVPRWGKPIRRQPRGSSSTPSEGPPSAREEPPGRQLRRGDVSGAPGARPLRRSDAEPGRRRLHRGAPQEAADGAEDGERPAPRRIRRVGMDGDREGQGRQAPPDPGREEPGGGEEPESGGGGAESSGGVGGPRRLRRSDEGPRRPHRSVDGRPRRIRMRGPGQPPEPEPSPPDPVPTDVPLDDVDGLGGQDDAESLLEQLREESGRSSSAGARSVGLRSSGDGDATFQVSFRGKAPRRARLRPRDTLAECAARLVQAMAAVPTDLTGRLAGWYRIEQEGVEGAVRVSDLDPRRVVSLEVVPNVSVQVTVEVEGPGMPIRFRSPIGVAVPVAFIVAHLVEWLALPGDGWTLSLRGETLEPWQILHDLQVEEGDVVSVRR